jgi:dethiobiotin synthetase
MPLPDQLVAVAGTGTDIGKTWVTAAVAARLRARGVQVAARKPAQSFDPSDPPAGWDAAVLAAATGESPDDVCPPHRCYERALAPPMAAAALGRPAILLDELVGELHWPAGVEVGFVETAGGVRSPIADDADNVALIDALAPHLVLLVADAGLGTLNLVRLSVGALAGHRCLVVLNRFDPADGLHRANADWLRDRDGLDVVTSIADLADLPVLGASFHRTGGQMRPERRDS